MKRLSDFFYRLVRPEFWVQIYRTDYKYDEILNDLLDSHEIEIITSNFIKLNGIVIWVSNYPYAYGTPYGADEMLPRPRTRVRLKEMVTSKRHNKQLSK